MTVTCVFSSVFAFLTVLTGPPVFAKSSNILDSRLHSIMRSKTKVQLEKAIGRHEDIQRDRENCEQQLESKKIPSACFSAIKKESEAGLIKAAGRRSQTEWLQQLCIRRANETRDLAQLQTAIVAQELPSECRRTIESRKMDVEYAAEVDNPLLLFRQRLNKVSESN